MAAETTAKIGWLDPSVDSDNDGDLIIADAVRTELDRLGLAPVRLPTHRRFSTDEVTAASACRLFILGGTNLLNSHPLRYRQWDLGPKELRLLRKKVLLLGVGWWQYEDAPDLVARKTLNWLLAPGLLHSVRDSYTQIQLEKVRVVAANTSCPTLWRFPRSGAARYGFRKTVIATVTDYNRDEKRDRCLLETLRNRAERLVIWPQGDDDINYIDRLGYRSFRMPRGIEILDEILTGGETEYVGTRLHAGIRALQHGASAVIVSIDNRAKEISRDTGLWTIERSEINDLDRYLDRRVEWSLSIPDAQINKWRGSITAKVDGASEMR